MRLLVLAACLLIGSAPKFDAARWREADPDGRVRANMLPSFLEQHPLKGMSRQQVVAYLGEPTKTGKRDDAEMVYVLGNDGGIFAIDHERLLIDLDQDQRVKSFSRTTD